MITPHATRFQWLRLPPWRGWTGNGLAVWVLTMMAWAIDLGWGAWDLDEHVGLRETGSACGNHACRCATLHRYRQAMLVLRLLGATWSVTWQWERPMA